MIQSTWEEQKSIKEVMIFLSSHGVSTTYAVKIHKQYGDSAIATVTTNPYQLAIAVKQVKQQQRYTKLRQRLEGKN